MANSNSASHTPVLIAGFGPVGLSLAIELAYRGIRSLLVEQSVGLPLEAVTLDNPRVREIYERQFVLVRPDSRVAWCGYAIPYDPVQIIDQVRGAALKDDNATV